MDRYHPSVFASQLGSNLSHLILNCLDIWLLRHPAIDNYIPTLRAAEGINYTHPENLQGAKDDGTNSYYFHIITRAHAKGNRKRRIIQNQENSVQVNVRWHMTGRTKAVNENGMHTGYRIIMVLHSTTMAGAKSVNQNWIMHQYHLGTDKKEKDDQLVVSKIFYQPQNKESSDNKSDNVAISFPENLGELSDEVNGEDCTTYLTDGPQDLDMTGSNFLQCNDSSNSMANNFQLSVAPFAQLDSQTSDTYQRDSITGGIGDFLQLDASLFIHFANFVQSWKTELCWCSASSLQYSQILTDRWFDLENQG